VTYTSPDATNPTVAIIKPTSASTYSTDTGSLSLAGTASDDRSLETVTWSTSGGQSGRALGTDSWSVSGVQLAQGETTVTVTATDTAGNKATDSLTVTYSAQDATPPSVEIGSPTVNNFYFTRSDTVDLNGSAWDNAQVQKVVWRNSTGNSGICYGTDSWSVTDVPLARYWNTITVTAFDDSGNASETSLTVFCWRR
jgi:hypothetical protein